MKLRYLTQSSANKLKKALQLKGIAPWCAEQFSVVKICGDDYFQEDESTEIDDDQFERITKLVPKRHKDVENSKAVFEALGQLTPRQAADERVWLYLTHCELWRYARERWPMPKEPAQAEKHIRSHYLLKRTNRALVRGNAISMLWWNGWFSSRCSLGIDKSLEVLLHLLDVRGNVFERPTIASNETIFEGIMQALHHSYKGDRCLFKRPVFRKKMKNLNKLDENMILEMLGSDRIRDILLEKV